MPMIRLQQGEEWQERFAKEYGNKRRLGFLPGLIVGGLLVMCAVYWIIPALQGLDMSAFSLTVPLGG